MPDKMRTARGLWIFYRKLILPSLVLSAFLGLLMMQGKQIIGGAGFAYIFLTPMFHFMIYDMTSPKEYFFYYNLGLSKTVLWINTIVLSLAIGLVLIAV